MASLKMSMGNVCHIQYRQSGRNNEEPEKSSLPEKLICSWRKIIFENAGVDFLDCMIFLSPFPDVTRISMSTVSGFLYL